jgi:hypothetical protein
MMNKTLSEADRAGSGVFVIHIREFPIKIPARKNSAPPVASC